MDAKRNRRRGAAAVVVLMAAILVAVDPMAARADLPVGSEEDGQAPVITAFTLSTTSVDVTTTGATINASVTATDDISGIAQITLRYQSPGGQNLHFSFAPGGALSGPFPGSTFVDTFRESGQWTLAGLLITDQVGNSEGYTQAEAAALGPSTITVLSNGDDVDPTASAVRVSPDPVDVSASNQTVWVEVDAADDGVGVTQLSVSFSSPDDGQHARVFAGAVERIAGDEFEGTYRAQLMTANSPVGNTGAAWQFGLPQGSRPGEWTIGFIQIFDRAGNSGVYGAADVDTTGIPLTVISDPSDATAPAITAFDFTPTAIDVTEAPATVDVTFDVEDDLAGVKNAWLTFQSPLDFSLNPVFRSRSAPAVNSLASPRMLDGTLVGSVTFPRFDRRGTWVVSQLCVQDWANRQTCYSGAQLTGLGPTELPVTDTSADLNLVKTASSGSAEVDAGDELTFDLDVTNQSTGTATEVEVTDTVPAGLTILSATPTQGGCLIDAQVVTCALGDIAGAGVASVEVSVRATRTGTWVNEAVVDSSNVDPDASDDEAEATVVVVPDALGCTIVGGPGDDTLVGTDDADVICGRGGADTLLGGLGDDVVAGQDGDDIISGQGGNDVLWGGAGNDGMWGWDGLDYMHGGPDDDWMRGGPEVDRLFGGPGIDRVFGDEGDDQVNTRDGIVGERANGGLGTDSCLTDPGDQRESCP